MSNPAPNPELLRALGRVARGLSALFWAVPLALIACVNTGIKNRLELSPLDFFFPVVATGVLVFGLWQLAYFQPQERVWVESLDRARGLALVNVGFAPFLFWRAHAPDMEIYVIIVKLMPLACLLFLITLNTVLNRLAAMLPDEALRQETSFFTSLNSYALLITPILMTLTLYLLFHHLLPRIVENWMERFQPPELHLFILLLLFPLAMTMSLIWKIKEVVLASVFGVQR